MHWRRVVISMPNTTPASRARLLFDPVELNYNFGADHPMQPRRLAALIDLLETSGLWQKEDERTRLPLRAATPQELALNHTASYIAAVQQLSLPEEDIASKEERVIREQ